MMSEYILTQGYQLTRCTKYAPIYEMCHLCFLAFQCKYFQNNCYAVFNTVCISICYSEDYQGKEVLEWKYLLLQEAF